MNLSLLWLVLVAQLGLEHLISHLAIFVEGDDHKASLVLIEEVNADLLGFLLLHQRDNIFLRNLLGAING